jgi:hypothetical protein
MGKYETLEQDIFAIFDSVAWKSLGIKTYPSNFVAINPGNEFVKISVVPSGGGLNLRSASGILMIDIYIPAGNGPRKASLIADQLDTVLSGKIKHTNGSVTQLFGSSMVHYGLDVDNQALHRSSYSVPFSHFGVQ